MSERLATRDCPMCGSRSAARRLAVESNGQRYDIVRCMACHFVFVANPRGETFEPVQQAPATVPERGRHRQIKRVCDSVLRTRLTERTCEVVEVGAGWGGLAQVFSRDRRYRYVGFEPSDARAAFCRARDLDVRPGVFAGPETLSGPVDAVVFDNVLEHVLHPLELVTAAVAALRPRGLLVVIVPNLHDLRQLRRSWRERHHWQPHCHINYFSRVDLERMFVRSHLQLRFFGFEALGSALDGLELLPRVVADTLGVHPFGLNVYGVKRSAEAR